MKLSDHTDAIHKAIGIVSSDDNNVSVTAFTGKLKVRVTKKMYNKNWHGELALTIGRPNYAETKYLKKHEGFDYLINKHLK